MNLILLRPDDLEADGLARLDGPRARHLIDVLGSAPGDTVRIGLIEGPMGVATVVGVGDGSVDLSCAFETQIPLRPQVDLLLALPRPKVLRRLWAQVAALGIGRIVLTNAERVERCYFDTHVLTPECYGPLLVEGLQQARDTRVPLVSIHRRFRVLIEDELDALCPDGLRLAAHPGEPRPLHAALNDRADRRVLLAVGPEGGWNDFELRLLDAHGFVRVGVGPRTLRSDTACIAMLAMVHQRVGRE